MTPNRHLVIFAKAPKLGTVKTRLAADIGRVAATGFYRRTLTGLINRLGRDDRWQCWIAISPDTAANDKLFRSTGARILKQGSGSLGQRMDRVFRALPPGPVVLVGADIPAIRGHHIESAFRALGRCDTVFGPADDGGYWLVGARRTPRVPDLFSGIAWSTDHTLADTQSKLANAGLKSAMVETLDDIDDGEAYWKWLTNVPSGGA